MLTHTTSLPNLQAFFSLFAIIVRQINMFKTFNYDDTRHIQNFMKIYQALDLLENFCFLQFWLTSEHHQGN